MKNADWAERDLKVVWHPCTQMQDHEARPPVPAVRGEGVWLYDAEGHRYLDAISSWWVNLFGHAHPAIGDAIALQARTLEHVLLAGWTHPGAIELAERLCRRAPVGLARCFFAENGSAAVEIALKMSAHYWRNVGAPEKHGFVSLAYGYHGETLGALALSDLGLYRSAYEPLLQRWERAPSPDPRLREPSESEDAYEARAQAGLEEILALRGHQIAAVVIEPLIQCAGGMRMHRPSYVRAVRALCDRYRVHLIADEIAVGFGRTGTLFACEQAGISPDFLCLGKGLTGGAVPLSACLTTATVYEAFYGGGAARAFLHSHSFTGNPVGCAAALATLNLFDASAVLTTLARRGETLWAALSQALLDHPHVVNLRRTGFVYAFEIVASREPVRIYPPSERRGYQLSGVALSQGLLLRPLGDTVYLMPPYVITDEEVAFLVEGTARAVDQVTG